MKLISMHIDNFGGLHDYDYDIVYKEIDSGNNFSGSSSLNEENKI